MNKRIMNKLRSRTGASILFALLLFLVCAVLCAVILVAATAAAGRMSGIAETDQRYYAVTSAAEMMKDLINDQSVTIEKITTGTKTENYSEGSVTSTADYDDTYTLKVNGATVNTANPSFASIVEDAGYKYIEEGGGTGNFTLQSSAGLKTALGAASGTDPLAVEIIEDVDENGNITLTIGNDYKVVMVFSASVTGPTVTETEGDSTTSVTSETQYTISTDVTRTETTTLTWSLTEIKTYF